MTWLHLLWAQKCLISRNSIKTDKNMRLCNNAMKLNILIERTRLFRPLNSLSKNNFSEIESNQKIRSMIRKIASNASAKLETEKHIVGSDSVLFRRETNREFHTLVSTSNISNSFPSSPSPWKVIQVREVEQNGDENKVRIILFYAISAVIPRIDLVPQTCIKFVELPLPKLVSRVKVLQMLLQMGNFLFALCHRVDSRISIFDVKFSIQMALKTTNFREYRMMHRCHYHPASEHQHTLVKCALFSKNTKETIT